MTYSQFIDNIKAQRPNKKFKGCERHHIIPVCQGGLNAKQNYIYLTCQEHFIAHQLLAKENPDVPELVYALFRMCDNKRIVTPQEYAEIREKVSQLQSEKFSGEGNPFYGHSHSIESRTLQSNAAINRFQQEENPFKGKTHSDESKRRMSESHRNQVWVYKNELSKMISKDLLEEYLSQGWLRGRPKSQFIGEKNPFYGKQHSQQTKEKIREINTGIHRPHSQQTKEKIRNSRTGSKKVICKICKRNFMTHTPEIRVCNNCK